MQPNKKTNTGPRAMNLTKEKDPHDEEGEIAKLLECLHGSSPPTLPARQHLAVYLPFLYSCTFACTYVLHRCLSGEFTSMTEFQKLPLYASVCSHEGHVCAWNSASCLQRLHTYSHASSSPPSNPSASEQEISFVYISVHGV